MAKGSFILHNSRRKVGNLVAYRLTGSNNKVTTAVREYQPEVSNPKTLAQANQRMRIPVAQAFYRAFRELLDHSWQGTRYRARSYNKFLQLAMSDKNAIIPFVSKGSVAFKPAAYLMSIGGLPAPQLVEDFSSDFIVTGYRMGVSADTITTWGLACAKLLANYPFLRRGDFLTYVEVTYDGSNYLPLYKRFTINPLSTTLLSQEFGALVVPDGNSDSSLAFSINANQMSVAGACLILSRQPAGRSRTWQRSSSRMILDPSYVSRECSQDAYQSAVVSYMSEEAQVNTDWYLNGGDVSTRSTPFTNPLGLVNLSRLINAVSVTGAVFNTDSSQQYYAKMLVNRVYQQGSSGWLVEPIVLDGATLRKGTLSNMMSSAPAAADIVTFAQAKANGVDFSGYLIADDVIQ